MFSLALRPRQRYVWGVISARLGDIDPVASIVELPTRVVVALAQVVETSLERGRYVAAKTAYAALQGQIFAMPHDEVVRLINCLGLKNRASAHLASSWAAARKLETPVLDFETAGVTGDSVGAMMAYRRRGKSAWGSLLSIREGEPVSGMCLAYWVKESNPILWWHRTRNEMKIALGPGNANLVNTAVKWSKADFLGRCTLEKAEPLIRERLGMTPEQFWKTAKLGDKSLVKKLGKIPSPLRNRMRRNGMQVAARQGPPPLEQLSLF